MRVKTQTLRTKYSERGGVKSYRFTSIPLPAKGPLPALHTHTHSHTWPSKYLLTTPFTGVGKEGRPAMLQRGMALEI